MAGLRMAESNIPLSFGTVLSFSFKAKTISSYAVRPSGPTEDAVSFSRKHDSQERTWKPQEMRNIPIFLVNGPAQTSY